MMCESSAGCAYVPGALAKDGKLARVPTTEEQVERDNLIRDASFVEAAAIIQQRIASTLGELDTMSLSVARVQDIVFLACESVQHEHGMGA
jgi:hypothetical protein